MNKAGLSGSEEHKSRMRAGEADLSQVASHRSHSSASHDGEGTDPGVLSFFWHNFFLSLVSSCWSMRYSGPLSRPPAFTKAS